MSRLLLAATTSATQSAAVIVVDEGGGRSTMPAHFTCPGIATGETGTLQKQNWDDTWLTYVMPNDEHIINDTNAGVAVYAPGIYRIDKSITAAATSVEVSLSVDP